MGNRILFPYQWYSTPTLYHTETCWYGMGNPKRHFGITCYSQLLPKVSVFPNLIWYKILNYILLTYSTIEWQTPSSGRKFLGNQHHNYYAQCLNKITRNLFNKKGELRLPYKLSNLSNYEALLLLLLLLTYLLERSADASTESKHDAIVLQIAGSLPQLKSKRSSDISSTSI